VGHFQPAVPVNARRFNSHQHLAEVLTLEHAKNDAGAFSNASTMSS
jgi:hypothetical protein